MACKFDLKEYGDITKLICFMDTFCSLWLTYITQSAIDSENYPSCNVITNLSHRSRKKENIMNSARKTFPGKCQYFLA